MTSTAADSAKTEPQTETKRTEKPSAASRVVNQIPTDILENKELNEMIARALPLHYNFEIHKTLWRIRSTKSQVVALQFPDGFLMYSCVIADILERFGGVETIIMGDVTYGACCVDDFTAKALGADLMVHYGHSCLVPIDVTQMNMLYVFVEIAIDVDHMIKSITHNFPADTKLVFAGTIQFASAIQGAATALKEHFKDVLIPQSKPLSKGEVLGCTSPRFDGYDTVVFVADGRFHLESMMIHNPQVKTFYKYDPYNKKLTLEQYGYEEMYKLRKEAIQTASKAKKWGLILGTLGRQGNLTILKHLEDLFKSKSVDYVVILLSEMSVDKLKLFQDIDAFVQVACPRLSIDWGYAYTKPLLSAYETEVALQATTWKEVYPMDFYSKDGGPWSNYYAVEQERAKKKKVPVKIKKVKRSKVEIGYKDA